MKHLDRLRETIGQKLGQKPHTPNLLPFPPQSNLTSQRVGIYLCQPKILDSFRYQVGKYSFLVNRMKKQDQVLQRWKNMQIVQIYLNYFFGCTRANRLCCFALCYQHCTISTVQLALCFQHVAMSTVLLAHCYQHCALSTVLLALCYQHCAFSTVLLALCYQHCAKSTVLKALC